MVSEVETATFRLVYTTSDFPWREGPPRPGVWPEMEEARFSARLPPTPPMLHPPMVLGGGAWLISTHPPPPPTPWQFRRRKHLGFSQWGPSLATQITISIIKTNTFITRPLLPDFEFGCLMIIPEDFFPLKLDLGFYFFFTLQYLFFCTHL